MNIYILGRDVNNYRWLNPIDKNNYDLSHKMKGDSFIKNWEKIYTETAVDSEDDLRRPYGDYPTFLEPLVSEKAKDIFQKKISGKVEFLEVIADGEYKFFIMNVLNVIDCLNKEKSSIKYFEVDGSIMDIKKYVFNSDDLTKEVIFRIKGYEKKIYVTDQFKKIVEENDLIGFAFQSTNDIPENTFADLIKKKKKTTKK